MYRTIDVATNEIIAVMKRKTSVVKLFKKRKPNLKHYYAFFANQKFPFMLKLMNKVL